MKITKYLLFIALLIISCSDDYLKINTTLKSITQLAKSKYRLDCVGSGVAAPNKIKNFRLIFELTDQFNQDEARKLIVNLTEDYIVLLNKTPIVVGNIENPPVNENHAFILIAFVDKYGKYQEKISGVELSNGNIVFLKNENGLEPYMREKYSEAYFKVYGTEPPTRN